MTMDNDHGHKMKEPREIPAGEFKAKCLKLMDEVQATGAELVITKRGKPVAKLVPAAREAATTSLVEALGCMKGSITILGDIVSPVLEDDWEEEWLKRWDDLHADDATSPHHARDRKGDGE